MRVGYAVQPLPNLASFRLRVAVPAPHIGCDYVIGKTGKPTFFYKDGFPDLAETIAKAGDGVVWDVVNDHFQKPSYRQMAEVADVISCGSAAMAEVIHEKTGRTATVIDDPYETDEKPPALVGNGVAWFGHSANLASLVPYLDKIPVIVCSNYARSHVPWSLENEGKVLQGAAVCLVTGSNPGASANRVVKALRAGRFVVVPEVCAGSWQQFEPYVWRGEVEEGVRWALNNREEACRKILAGQDYIRQKFSPQLIGSQWGALFASI